ncbi:hypothetical protein ACFO6R_00365 [Eubacterium multiforme]|uniref:DNA binding CopG/RHH family protein n=1 Tax=Eubacterium multiforme TaxID=83339 RepID=A0ABT9UR47_9FIRM|nr:hypothetical protein [Eubacterium multiforme]MDQ0148802.1 putative DNA binding CopG/RHH family protein [Eubacterium multiforme]
MKKILMVVLLSIVTSMTIYFVAFWNPNKNINNNLVLQDESKAKNRFENKNEDNNFENKDIENINNKNENKQPKSENNSNKKYEEKDVEIENKEKNKNYNINVEKNNDENESNDGEKDKLANSKVQIFNVKKEEIIGSLSIREKSKIISIINKLSSVDTEKIKEILYKKGENEGAKEVIKILKLRLVEEDYNDIKVILSPYINIELLEELI